MLPLKPIMKKLKPLSILACSLTICSSCTEQKNESENAFTTFQATGESLTVRTEKDISDIAFNNGIRHYTAHVFEDAGNNGKGIIWLPDEEKKRYDCQAMDAYKIVKMKQNAKMIASFIIGIALISSILLIMLIRRRLIHKESENALLRKKFDDLMMEREELSRAQTRNTESRTIINERLKIIDQFVMSEALNDSVFEEMALQRLSELINDRKEFTRQTRLIFSSSHPEFISFLTERGLTEKELELCCLYAIGLNGKMVTSFTNVKRHYHTGCDIRKKLGLNGHDTNISIYIRNLLEELEYNGN